MEVSRFIAGRLKFKGRIATVSIAISFLVMIVSLAVSSGFRREIRRGVAGIAGDVRLTDVRQDYLSEDSPLAASPSWLAAVDSIKGVREIRPVIYRAGVIKNGENIHGVVFKGVETDDSLAFQARIPSRLATLLDIAEGDEVPAYFVGTRVKARKFKVSGIYQSILGMDEALVVYVSIDDLRRLNGWQEGDVSAFEISLDDRYENPRAINEKTSEIGAVTMMCRDDEASSVLASSVVQRFPELFDWLGIIDFNVAFILVLMTVVAGFNMISGLLILLFRHISTIGTLKAMGMTDKGISAVFLRVSSTLVLKGMAAGNAVAILICAVQGATHVMKLNPENYFVSFVPMHLNVPLILAVDIISYVVIMCLLLLPCMFISKVDPAKTVRSA